jgi:hypothetical protein
MGTRTPPIWLPILLLFNSSVFMTFAWPVSQRRWPWLFYRIQQGNSLSPMV